MDVTEAIRSRRSVRRYEARGVSREMLLQLMEAACWAPSAGNMQTWKFVAITDPGRLRKLRMVSPGLIGDPPAAIIVCENVAESLRRAGEAGSAMATVMDAAMAAFAICLQAHAEGFGTCLVGSFNPQAVARLVHLPEGMEAKLVISVGYPAVVPKAPPRKTEGVYHFEVYDG